MNLDKIFGSKHLSPWVFGVGVSSICVLDEQTKEEMLELAEYAVKNFGTWKVLLANPCRHSKEEILSIAKPLLKYLHANDYAPSRFNFSSWNLWTRKNEAGCPCGRRLLGIMPDLQVIPGNGEEYIKLGKFAADDFLGIINDPLNTYYREDVRPTICTGCELEHECDGDCRMCHTDPAMLKERCDAVKELFEYVRTLER